MGLLDDRKILITGGSSGIGEATAKAIVAEGGSVALGARRKDKLDEIVDGLSGDGKAVAIEADVSDEDQARKLVEEANEELGGLDGLVNNAGVMLLGPVLDADTEDWRTMLDVNLLGLLFCTHAALPVMKEAGEGRHRERLVGRRPLCREGRGRLQLDQVRSHRVLRGAPPGGARARTSASHRRARVRRNRASEPQRGARPAR